MHGCCIHVCAGAAAAAAAHHARLTDSSPSLAGLPACPAALPGAAPATSAASRAQQTSARPPPAPSPPRCGSRTWPPSQVRHTGRLTLFAERHLQQLLRRLRLLPARLDTCGSRQRTPPRCHRPRQPPDAPIPLLSSLPPQATGCAPPAPTSTSNGGTSATSARNPNLSRLWRWGLAGRCPTPACSPPRPCAPATGAAPAAATSSECVGSSPPAAVAWSFCN